MKRRSDHPPGAGPLPESHGVTYFTEPLGKTCTTALRWICTSTPAATSRLRWVSPILDTLPSRPPEVTTSSPLASASIMARCSFWRFIWGRIITKYSTTNISTSGSMLVSDDMMSPPPAAAAGAVWAKAEEMNTENSTGGNKWESPQADRNGAGRRVLARLYVGPLQRQSGAQCPHDVAGPGPAHGQAQGKSEPDRGPLGQGRAGPRVPPPARASGGGLGGRAALAPFSQQLVPALARRGQVALLDVAIALDLLRHLGQIKRQGMALGAQAGAQLLHQRLVLGDQGALSAALFGAAEHVKRRAAQALEPSQQPEAGEHGRPERLLDQVALGVLLGKQGRRQVVVELVITLELLPDAGQEGRIAVQARHLVLVLVGHQLEGLAGHGLAQRGLAQGRLGLLHPAHQGAVALGIGGVLVGTQKLDPARHQRLDRLAGLELHHLAGRQHLAHQRRVMRGQTAPVEGRLVGLDRHRVELDGAGQGGQAQRNPTALPGI